MMNLKEAFRYQNFLDRMIRDILMLMYRQDYCMKTTKTHFKSKSNPDATDTVEEENVELIATYEEISHTVDMLIEYKKSLTIAINEAKPDTYDAMIDANKYAREYAKALQASLRFTPSVSIAQGSDYKFNAEGNQMPYKYDVEIKTEDRFDRKKTKNTLKAALVCADADSSLIDQITINTKVDYDPFIDVNASIEDVIETLNS